MERRLDNKVFWILIGVLVIAFFGIKTAGPIGTKILYDHGAFGVLNSLTRTTENLPFAFYRGRMDDFYFGPFSLLVFNMAFLIFGLRYLLNADSRMFGLCVFLYLFISKYEIWFFPPYGDAIGGPFTEAIWLFRHHFDYVALAHQPGYLVGGPKVYLLSVYPTFQALLLKLIPNTKAFLFINHNLTFLFASVIFVYFRKILLKVFDSRIAFLTSMLFLVLPLMQSQMEAINMELPVLAFAMPAIYFAATKNIRKAFLLSIGAVLVKGYAILVCGSIFAMSLILFLWDEQFRFRVKPFLWGIGALVFAFFNLVLSSFVFKEYVHTHYIKPFVGWATFRVMIIFYLYSISLAAFLFVGIKDWRKRTRKESVQGWLNKYYIPVTMFMTALAWFVLFLNSYAVSPRYRILAYPFVLFSAVYALFSVFKNLKTLSRLLVAVLIISSVCSYGFPLKQLHGIQHVVLERSLEYRNDERTLIDVTHEIEQKYSHFLIGAPFLVAQVLVCPELGYVSKKLNVMIYGYPLVAFDVKEFEGLQYTNPGRTLWVGYKKDLLRNLEYPISALDQIIEEVYNGNKKATLFMGGLAIERARLIVRWVANQELYKSIEKKKKPLWVIDEALKAQNLRIPKEK